MFARLPRYVTAHASVALAMDSVLERDVLKRTTSGSDKQQLCQSAPPDKRVKIEHDRSIGQEVVRRHRLLEVTISIQAAAALRPDARTKWLAQALERVTASAARPSDVFDVISHDRFAAGVSGAMAKKMMEELWRQASLFPDKLRQAILEGKFVLGQAAASFTEQSSPATNRKTGVTTEATEAMMARCVDFVRRNEPALQQVHNVQKRTFQAELFRSSTTQVWGLTWVKEAFEARRRVVQAIVPGSPAAMWNADQHDVNLKLRVGDELVAVNGCKTWEDMAVFKNLLEARLTFVHERLPDPVAESPAPSCRDRKGSNSDDTLSPPLFDSGDYTLDSAGSGWWGHSSSAWLFNKSEGVYFHRSSGSLFIEATPGEVVQVGGDAGESRSSELLAKLAPPSQLRGCIRWFARTKGFGFIAMWPNAGGAAPADLFVHRSELLQPRGRAGEDCNEGDSSECVEVPLLPGMPVEFNLSVQDGKPCAVGVRQQLDLNHLCRAGFSAGASARPVDKRGLGLKAETGHAVTACFAGLVTGRRGMGGAEFVSLNLAKDLATSFQGREQGGERGARAALLAGLQRTQQGFVQYAQRLSENSARLWLSSETSACTALIFAPDSEGRPLVLFASVGRGGCAKVVRKDGTVSASLGNQASVAPSKDDENVSRDSLKAFKHGLKGPAIKFPDNAWLERRLASRGFTSHASDKKGVVILEPHIEVCQLDWQEDAVLLLGSEALWASLSDEVGLLACHALAEAASAGRQVDAEKLAAERLIKTAQNSKSKCAPEHLAAGVLRFTWAEPLHGASSLLAAHAVHRVTVEGNDSNGSGDTSANLTTSSELFVQQASHDFDDMFAAPKVQDKLSSTPASSGLDDTLGDPEAQPQSELDSMFASFCSEIDSMTQTQRDRF
eukprot:TRINITY_DN20140_c0_g1_i2.p1 TRINITY_DN20140_c0_g1~~TRINITY_DN20140_c0_g1_i2.p1  ORF type:complete len:898 (-),score=178.83 TRINITY_DN20140_c0_g1_i2:578-3271(-)